MTSLGALYWRAFRRQNRRLRAYRATRSAEDAKLLSQAVRLALALHRAAYGA